MQIQIESSHLGESSKPRDSLEERVRFVFRRMQHEIRQIRVRLLDVNGPRGGADKQCRITLKLSGPGTLVVTSQANSGSVALDSALDRASQSLVRLWQRKRRPRRANSEDSRRLQLEG